MSKVITGIRRLDNMLKGGFPEVSIILMSGGPGSGKTVLSAQFYITALNAVKQAYIFRWKILQCE